MIAQFTRFIAVGLANSVVGYAVILLGLWLGLDDYAANAAGYAVGLTLSYGLQRWAFSVRAPASGREAARFLGAAALAYGVNLGVLAAARGLGYVHNPLAQAAAMVAYSLSFFVLSRFVVFAPSTGAPAAAPPPTDGTPTDGTVVGWLQSPLVFVALCLAAMAPLAFTHMPPLADVGGHLGRFAVQVDGGASPVLRQWYGFHWALIPNLGVDMLMQLLAPPFGLEPALKLIVVAIPALQVAGWLWLARAVHGHIPPTALFALPLAYGFPFEFGFINFCLSMALASCFLALWISLGNAKRWQQRWGLFALLACVLWVTHLVGWAVFCLLAGAEVVCREGARVRAGEQPMLRAARAVVVQLSCLLMPWLVRLALPAASAGHGRTGDFFSITKKLIYLGMAMRERWARWDVGAALIILLLITWSWRSRRFVLSGWLMLGVCGLALVYMLLPGQLLGSAFADMRLVPTLLAMALLAVRPAPTSPASARWPGALAIAALVFTTGRFAGNFESMALFDQQFTQDLAALKAVPRDTSLISLAVEPCLAMQPGWIRERRTHLAGYAIGRNHDFSNDQWVIPGGQLLQVHNPAARPFEQDPSQNITAINCDGRLGVPDSVAHIPPAMRWLWVIENGKPRALPGWHPVAFTPGSVVYTRD